MARKGGGGKVLEASQAAEADGKEHGPPMEPAQEGVAVVDGGAETGSMGANVCLLAVGIRGEASLSPDVWG